MVSRQHFTLALATELLLALRTIATGTWSTLFALLPISAIDSAVVAPNEAWHTTRDPAVVESVPS
jgi:hypothetical protein